MSEKYITKASPEARNRVRFLATDKSPCLHDDISTSLVKILLNFASLAMDV